MCKYTLDFDSPIHLIKGKHTFCLFDRLTRRKLLAVEATSVGIVIQNFEQCFSVKPIIFDISQNQN